MVLIPFLFVLSYYFRVVVHSEVSTKISFKSSDVPALGWYCTYCFQCPAFIVIFVFF